MHFDIHTTGKRNRDRKLRKNYNIKKFLLTSCVPEVVLLSENLNKLGDRLYLIFQNKTSC